MHRGRSCRLPPLRKGASSHDRGSPGPEGSRSMLSRRCDGSGHCARGNPRAGEIGAAQGAPGSRQRSLTETPAPAAAGTAGGPRDGEPRLSGHGSPRVGSGRRAGADEMLGGQPERRAARCGGRPRARRGGVLPAAGAPSLPAPGDAVGIGARPVGGMRLGPVGRRRTANPGRADPRRLKGGSRPGREPPRATPWSATPRCRPSPDLRGRSRRSTRGAGCRSC